MVNAFQSGQQFQQQQELGRANTTRAENREKGINALAKNFGDEALAPTEMSTVRGTVRADKTAASNEEQRGINNERIAVQDAINLEDRQKKNQLQSARNVVSFLKKVRDDGGDVATAIPQVQDALIALGTSEEDIGQLPQFLSENPDALDAIEASIMSGLQRRAIGKPFTVTLKDGTRQLMQQYSDGLEPVQGADGLVTDELADTRNDIASQRIDPNAARILEEEKAEGKAVGKAKGEILAGDLQPGKRATAQGKLLLKQRELKNEFLQNTIDTALEQATGFTTGIFSGVRFLGGTPQADLATTLDTIRANVGFEELQRMRDASPTGGALGQVSERENTLLQAVWGSVEQSQSKEQLQRNLKILKDTVEASRARVAEAFEADFGTVYGGEGTVIPGTIENDVEVDDEIQALLDKYGAQQEP